MPPRRKRCSPGGAVSHRLGEWRIPCLVYLGASDLDFLEQARRAASDIPKAEFIELGDLDQLGAHFEATRIGPAVPNMLRRNS